MKKFEMISHRVGIDAINQSIVNVENKAEIAEKYQSARTMVKFDQCMICNSMDTDRMRSCLYQFTPNSIWSMVVHCDNPICFSSSRFVIKNELAEAKRFFVTQDSLKKLFPNAEILIERSDGSTIKAKISYQTAAVFSKSRLCVGFWVSFIGANGEALEKVSTLDEIFSHNKSIVSTCQDLGKIPIEILDKSEFATDFPAFFHHIEMNLKELCIKYKIQTLNEILEDIWEERRAHLPPGIRIGRFEN